MRNTHRMQEVAAASLRHLQLELRQAAYASKKPPGTATPEGLYQPESASPETSGRYGKSGT